MKIKSVVNNATVAVRKEICNPESVIEKYILEEMNYENEEHLKEWCDLINNGYEDVFYETTKQAKFFLQNHPFIEDNRTVFLKDNSNYVGTVTFGRYRSNNNVGGAVRYCVSKNYNRQGIGLMLIKIAEYKLYEMGVRDIESLIKLKRTPSLFMHFKAGYVPKSIKKRIVEFKKRKRNKGEIPYFLLCVCVNVKLYMIYYKYIINILLKELHH